MVKQANLSQLFTQAGQHWERLHMSAQGQAGGNKGSRGGHLHAGKLDSEARQERLDNGARRGEDARRHIYQRWPNEIHVGLPESPIALTKMSSALQACNKKTVH